MGEFIWIPGVLILNKIWYLVFEKFGKNLALSLIICCNGGSLCWPYLIPLHTYHPLAIELFFFLFIFLFFHRFHIKNALCVHVARFIVAESPDWAYFGVYNFVYGPRACHMLGNFTIFPPEELATKKKTTIHQRIAIMLRLKWFLLLALPALLHHAFLLLR